MKGTQHFLIEDMSEKQNMQKKVHTYLTATLTPKMGVFYRINIYSATIECIIKGQGFNLEC